MISQFRPDRNAFKNYDHYDGLPGRDIKEAWYHGRGLMSSIGQLYFGTGWGVVVFHPDSIQQNNFVPPVSLTSLSIHNQPVPVSHSNADTLGWKSPLSKSISYSEEVVLNYDQNDFSLEFSALNYINAENNRYKYKLEPYENEWVQAKDRRASYTNISPGRYTFRVIGSNNDDTWNYEGAKLSIVVVPPWWQTWWAYSLYGLAFIGLILSWHQYDIKRVKLKHRAEHLSELDQLKSRFFTNISHEFRTPLSTILSSAFLVKQYGSEEELLKRNKHLQRIITSVNVLTDILNDFLSVGKIEEGKVQVRLSQFDVREHMQAFIQELQGMLKERQLIDYVYSGNSEVLLDPSLFRHIVINLLGNAIKFSGPGTTVRILTKVADKKLLLTVEDEGLGISEEDQQHLFERFYRGANVSNIQGTGLGLHIVSKYSEMMHGKVTCRSALGRGTMFSVEFDLERCVV